MTRKAIISFKNFTFQYDAQSEPTLRDISLTIYEGEKILIVGASGSGKSTLLNCLNGIIPQNHHGSWTGELMISGKRFGEDSIYELSLSVGTVLQDTDSQFVGLTVAEDIAFLKENEAESVDAMHDTVKTWATKINLGDHLDHKPSELSGGQKQRVTLAGVLVDEPPIILFDEPLANLDPQTGYDTMRLIDQLASDEQLTALIIEHRLEESLVAKIDRVVLIDDGQIVTDLPPDQLLKQTTLTDHGIREPLYLTALKTLGIDLDAMPTVTDCQQMATPVIKKALNNWQEAHPFKIETPKQTPLLTLDHLNFSYHKGNPLLKDISLTLHKGEMVSLVGHNGAGKSTLSHVISGFLTPDSGDIKWDGRSILEDSIAKRATRIGYVLQNANQMLSQSNVYDEVALGLRNRSVPEQKIEEKVVETLVICGLKPYRNWPMSALSHGQKRRVAIAAILVLEPDLLILDEPTAGQDFRHYNDMMTFLEALNRQGKTILMVTHDMHLMLEYTERTIVLKEGTIVADKTPAAVLTDQLLVADTSLKTTSLYDLAAANQLADPTTFVENFIRSEREDRDNGK